MVAERLRAAWAALVGRKYAAAKGGGSIGHWYPVNQDVNVEIGSSQYAINARVRQLVRDMPHAARAVDVLSGWVVGPGLVFQSRITGSDGKLAKRLNTQIEDAWKWWADEADLAGRLTLPDLQALAIRQLVEIGEFVLVKTATAAPGRYLPLALRVIEADRLSGDRFSAALPGNEVYSGVEYDPRTGRSVAYWFDDDSTVGAVGRLAVKPVRLEARRVIHGFQTLRPGQLRGVSPFAPAVLLAHSLRDYLEAEIDAAKMAARWLAFVKTPDPAGTMLAFGAKTDATLERKTEEIGTAIKEYLLPGEDVVMADHNRPGDAFSPFTRFCLQSFGAVLGVPYELLSGNYEGLNYSVLRGIRNDFSQSLATLRARFVRQFCVPVQREFMSWLALTGKVSLPGYLDNPWPYLRGVWLGPGLAPVDPLKEGRADLDAIAGRLKSPQECILDRGRDPEEVLGEIAQWEEQLQEKGLKAEPPESPLKSNPAALDEEGGTSDDTADEGGDTADEGDDAEAADRRLRRVK